MPITVTSSPAQINSVADAIEYELTLTPTTVLNSGGFQTTFGTNSSSPYGLAIFQRLTSAALPAAQLPTLSVGSIIYITSGTAYKGSHVIVEVIDADKCVVNTIYAGPETSMQYDVYTDFNYTISEYPSLTIDGAIWTIAQIKGTPKNDKIKLNISEYLRSRLNESKKSLCFNIAQFDFVINRAMVTNSVLKTSVIDDFFDVNATLIETASTLVFFEGFSTYISVSEVINFPVVIRKINDITPFTQGSTFTYQKLSSQSVEIQKGCFKDALNIVYVNFAGGLRNYVVYNDIGIGRDFDNETTFKDNNLNLKTLAVQSFKTYSASTENIRTTHQETIEQMIASPFTWLEVEGELIPIVIEKQSILLYRSYNEAISLAFNFRFSETYQSQVL